MKITKTGLFFLMMCYSWIFPSVAVAQQLDPELTQLIQRGLEKNHGVQVQEYESQQAKLDQKLAKSVFLPKISLNGSYTRLNDDITFDEGTTNLLVSTQKLLIKEAAGLPFNSPFPESIALQEVPSLQNKNILKSSVDLDWVLFSGFEATNALKASKHKEASLNYALLAEKDKIALQIIETYDKLALVKASEKVLSTSEDYLEEQEYYVKKAIENGLATPISRNKVELARQQLASRQLDYKQKTALLLEVLHQLTGESIEKLQLLEPQLNPLSPEVAVLPEKRNEVKALEEAEKAGLYKAKMERSNFIPKLALKGHYELLEDDLSLLDPVWYVGVGVKWNIFDGTQSRLKGQKAELESRKYGEKKEEAEEMIALSITKARLGYESALQNVSMVQKEIELARATYTMVNKQYKNDLASINDVLDALTDLEKANFKLQESYFNQRRAVTDLLHAKGILTY
ncbi:MAG: TolC family protein [Salinimicrobium sp.]